MGRSSKQLSPNVTLIWGNDHAVGGFLQIADSRYANSGKDEQGEGYVMDYDQMFGFNINLISATKEDFANDAKLLELCDNYAKTLPSVKDRIMGKFFVYCTVWTEGEVVVHSSDIGFATGYSPMGGIHYVKSLDELLATPSFRLISVHDKESDTVGMNTSLYPRKESPYCQICNRVLGSDDVAHCSVSDCPHINKLDDETE